jgi:minor extracellular serine protease Vpr
MTILIRYSKSCLLFLIIGCIAFGADLTDQQRKKLHPIFKSIVAKSNLKLLKTTSDSNPLYGAIVYTDDVETLRSMGIRINSVLPDFVTAQLAPSDLTRLANLERVRYIDPGRVHKPLLDVSVPETGATLLHGGFLNNTSYKGKGAIVLIYDTGIDWKHFDFRKAGDTTKSRILSLWDQTLDSLAGDQRPNGFNYGVEYTQTQIENEFSSHRVGMVREKDTHGHGTHVASIAAGNGQAFNNKYIGMAPEADIIVVKGGDDSFSEVGEIDGLTYAMKKATALGKPIVVNMSLGGQVGPHDGTNADEVAIDNFIGTGRVVCVAAGNDGAHTIHVNGSVSTGSPTSFSVSVPVYTATSKGANKNYILLDMWLPNAETVTMSLVTPSNKSYVTPADSSLDGLTMADGTIDSWNYVESQNAHRHIQVWIHDATDTLPKTGTWKVSLQTTESSVAFDGWIDSDLGGARATLPNGNSNETVGMPGSAKGAITVGSYTTKSVWYDYMGNSRNIGTTDGAISSFSSIGPTADHRQKPDIAAPGQIIVAALSSNVNTTGSVSNIVIEQKYQEMQGTSMATPHVTGGAALLLGANPTLTATQIKNLFTGSANSDSYVTTLPNYYWGYGKLDVAEAMAKSLWGTALVSRTTVAYDGASTTSLAVRVTSTAKTAVRFSPPTTGTLSGIQVFITSLSSKPIVGTGPLICEVFSDNAGLPGTRIGTSVSQPFNLLSPFTNNYIQMLSANASVTAGTDYHIVLSVGKASDSILVRYEDVTTGTRSSLFTGGVWSAQTYNIRIRSIITSTSGLSDVENLAALQPLDYHLNQNYPNPFNPSTTIEYGIPVKGFVRLQIFDVLGRLVATLVDDHQDAGVYRTTWRGTSNRGIALSSGVYFYRLESGNFSKTARMLLLK